MLRLLLAAMLVTAGCSSGPAPEKPKTVAASNGKEPAPNRPAVQVAPLKVGTGAILDLTRSPLGTLFETKLLAGEKLKWLERSLIDKVLAEQELQALFSPEAGSQRANFGKVLKADVLILLRSLEDPAKKEASRLELVVCETQRGLRLAAHTIAASKDAAADVDALDRFVDEALKKAAGKITDVCAVPPFMNNDLDYKYDHLKAAFAQLIENQVIKRPGVLVVELAEAQALAKEAALAGGDNVQRHLPLYFLGEFRNEGRSEDRRLTVHVKLKRGEKELAAQTKNQIVPKDVAGVLSRTVDEMAEKVLAKAGDVPTDPKSEAKQLVERALAFERVGNWENSLALLEASLLLDASEPIVRHRAALACAKVSNHLYRKTYQQSMAALVYHRRMLEHDELYVLSAPKVSPPFEPDPSPSRPRPPAPTLNEGFHYPYVIVEFRQSLFQHKDADERKAGLERCDEVYKQQQELLLRLCRWRAQNGNGDEHFFLSHALTVMPAHEKHQTIWDMVHELKDLPWAKSRTMMFARLAFRRGQLAVHAEDAAFFNKLMSVKDPNIRTAAEMIWKEENSNRAAARTTPKDSEIPADAQEIRYRPLNLVHQGPDGKALRLDNVRGWLRFGNGVDLVEGQNRLYLMTEKGRLRKVWEEVGARPTQYCFDGRYAWIPIHRQFKVPRLLVLEPSTEKVWEFSADDGLPLAAPETLPNRGVLQYMAAAPLAPGKVLLAGYFARSWLAIATFDPKEGKSVKVFHEARETVDNMDPKNWQRTTVAFEPRFMHVLTDQPDGAGRRAQRVVLGRRPYHESHSLLIDPEKLTVEVMPESISGECLERGISKEGALYFVWWGNDFVRQLYRLGFPNLKPELVTKSIPAGHPVYFGDRLHVFVEQRDWTASLANKADVSFGLMINGYDRVYRSEHYGVVVTAEAGLKRPAFQVDFPAGQRRGVGKNILVTDSSYPDLPGVPNLQDIVQAKPVVRSDPKGFDVDREGWGVNTALSKEDRTASGQLAKSFRVELTAGKTYDFRMTSKEFPAQLKLAKAGKMLAASPKSDGIREVRLDFIAPETGTYDVSVHSVDGRLGAFGMRVARPPAQESKPIAIPANQEGVAHRDLPPAKKETAPRDFKAVGAAAMVDPDSPPATKKAPTLDFKAVGTGAVVDLSGTPIGALFEAKVIGSRNMTWVERSHVEKVLREQQLQAVFGADSGSKRTALGKLLKADVLVMLRTSENVDDKDRKGKLLDVVICESQRGLRLAVEAIALSDNGAGEVEFLESVLDGALAKVSAKISEVCAVPPFINNDLTYKYDHLKGALARALEQQLLKRKGVLVVELAEAQAVAKEAALSGQEGIVERPLPLYFLGAFRHEGKDAERRLQLSLKLQRGEKLLADRQDKDILPAEAPKALFKLADAVADKTAIAGDAGAADPKAEVAQLAERAAAHRLVGNWRECLDLLEAALLLDPSHADLHNQASHACFVLVLRLHERRRAQPDNAMLMLHTYQRGLEHMEIAVRPTRKTVPPVAPNVEPLRAPAPSDQFGFAYGQVLQLRYSSNKQVIQQLLEIVQEHRAVMTQLCRLRAQAGFGDEHRFLTWAVESMPRPRQYALVRSLLEELKDLPHAKERTFLFAHTVGGAWYGKTPDPFPAFLDELAAHPHPEIRAGAQALKKDREADLARAKLRASQPNAAAATAPSDVIFQQVPLTHGIFKKTRKPAGMSLRGVVNLDRNVDCLIAGNAVFLMRQKDVAKPVWVADELNCWPDHHCYDGRYVWFSLKRIFKTPRLLVLDPETEKVFEFGEADGLPIASPDSLPSKNVEQVIGIAPLAPGRVCVAGYFGKSWIGIATFSPSQGKSIKIIHEAREIPLTDAPNQWLRSTIVFRPFRMFVLKGEQRERRLLIGRDDMHDGANSEVAHYPLLLDPETSAITVMKERLYYHHLEHGQARDGAFYYVGPDKQLLKMTGRDGQRIVLMRDVPLGRLIVAGDDVHILEQHQRDWWHGSLKQGNIRKLGQIPKGAPQSVNLSQHYGVIVTLSDGGDYKTYRVLPSAKKN